MSKKYLNAVWAAVLAGGLVTACGGGGGGGGAGDNHIDLSTAAPVELSSQLRCEAQRCDLRLYQIMVEAFIDGDPQHDHGTGYGTSHHKGDLKGVIDSLDYIRALGVNAIWLTPIFESTPKPGQDHWADRLDATGYYASNYFKVDPKFGTEAQLRALVDGAHQRGMYVFLDGVFGHYKDNIVASPSGLKPKNGQCVNERGGTYTAGPNSACADYSAPETKAFFREVATYWINEFKIDGWRLDQAYQVPVSDWAWLRGWVEHASSRVTYNLGESAEPVNPLGHMVAEIWSDENRIAATAYGSAQQPALESAFDFPLRYRLAQTLATEESATPEKTAQPASTLAAGYNTRSAYPAHARPNLMLGNHDLVRFGDLIQRAGLADVGDDGYWQRHKAAFSFLVAHSGPITVYYGDEIGQEVPGFAERVTQNCALQGLCDDHVARSSGMVQGVPTLHGGTPSVLNDRQADLRNHVADLMGLRTANPALAVGERLHLHADDSIYIDRKISGSNRVLYVLNSRPDARTVSVARADVADAAGLTDLQSNAVIHAAGGNFSIEVPGLSARFLRY